jgi:hypothetical protein
VEQRRRGAGDGRDGVGPGFGREPVLDRVLGSSRRGKGRREPRMKIALRFGRPLSGQALEQELADQRMVGKPLAARVDGTHREPGLRNVVAEVLRQAERAHAALVELSWQG